MVDVDEVKAPVQVGAGGAHDLASEFVGAGVGGIGRHGHFEEVVVALLDALRRDEAGDFHERRGDGRLGFGPVGLVRAGGAVQEALRHEVRVRHALPAREVCRVVARGHVAARAFGEARGIRRRQRVAERGVGDDAAGLVFRAAERDLLQRAARVLVRRDRDGGAEDHRRNEQLLRGLAFDLVGNKAREDAGALAVADEDHAAAVVLVGHVPVPRVKHVIVAANAGGETRAFRLRAAAGDAQGGKCGLAIDGRELAADRAEASELQLDVLDLHLVDGPVGRPGLVVGDGGIGEEAVELRVRRGLVLLDRGLAVLADDGGVEIDLALVVGESGTAEPERGVGEVGVGDVDGGKRLRRERWRGQRGAGAATDQGHGQRGARDVCAHCLSPSIRIIVRLRAAGNA